MSKSKLQRPKFHVGQIVRFVDERKLDPETGVSARRVYIGTIVRVPTFSIVDDWPKRTYYGVRVDAPDGVTTIFNAYEQDLQAIHI